MTREELLEPRYKVMIDYPLSNFKVGDVIEPWEVTGWHPKEFPNVFRKMWWTEERKKEDMPKYLRIEPIGFVHTALDWKFEMDPSGIELAYFKCPVNDWTFCSNLHPATEEEFQKQQKGII